MNWSLEERYRRLDEVDSNYIDEISKKSRLDSYYPKFHISPRHGLLNDPNGLCYFNGEHHIFYQWFPLGPVHGLKYWYHVSTVDFVKFNDRGIALAPGTDYDSHGCYSGSGISEGDLAYLFFTGNKRDSEWKRTSTQCYATMDSEGNIEKKGIIIENKYFTEHFRDPKVWKENDKYYMVLGVQTKELKGQMALYYSDNINEWEYKGIIKTDYSDYGFMWECPDYFELNGKGIMLFSPQGVDSKDKYTLKNIYNVVYILGDPMNKDRAEFENHGSAVELDSGFDFYASQTYEDNKGRRILIGWVGLPEIEYPTDNNMWANMLTIPRQLNIVDNLLIQSPIEELKDLRDTKIELDRNINLNSCMFEIEFETELDDLEIKLCNHEGEGIKFSMNLLEFELDRSNMTDVFATKFGTSRFVKRTDKKQKIIMYFDNSVMEIFINNGKNTMTSRIFVKDLSKIIFSEKVDGSLYYLKPIEVKKWQK